MASHSVRIPPEMLRKLDLLAEQRGVPKSQLVREALEQYLEAARTGHVTHPMSVRQRSAPYIGAINLPEPDADETISDRMYRHNWRA